MLLCPSSSRQCSDRRLPSLAGLQMYVAGHGNENLKSLLPSMPPKNCFSNRCTDAGPRLLTPPQKLHHRPLWISPRVRRILAVPFTERHGRYRHVPTMDKGGPKFKQSDSQDPFDIHVKGRPTGLFGTRVSMERWSFDLAQWLRVPVVDDTGLAGYYELKFDWRPQPPPDDASIFTALREQLGLKLEARKAPVEFSSSTA